MSTRDRLLLKRCFLCKEDVDITMYTARAVGGQWAHTKCVDDLKYKPGEKRMTLNEFAQPERSNFEQIGSRFTEYQQASKATAVYPAANTGSIDAITYCALKMAGEAGEVAEKVAKLFYRLDDIPIPDGSTRDEVCKEILVKEMGDVLWYIAQMCTELNVPLGSVALKNYQKLTDRKERGVLKGSGDNR